MVDYVRLAATAKRLIDKNGTDIVFEQLNGTTTPDKPWTGPGDPVVKQSVTLRGLFVSPATMLGLKAIDEDLLKRYEQFIITAPASPATPDLTLFHRARRVGASDYSIGWAEQLRPADVVLLYYLGVNR